MVVSHKYQYVFVEIPYTASTAISNELCECYSGESILHKHSHYYEFVQAVGSEAGRYFRFAGVRNPLDAVVSVYFKQRTNHQGFFTTPEFWEENGGHVSNYALQQYQFTQEHPDDFVGYLKKFFRIPVDIYGSIAPGEFDYIIRFETLQEDFSQVLRLLGIPQVRSLPQRNRTGQRGQDFSVYYTPDTYEHVRRVFGPVLQEWNYDLPSGDDYVPATSRALFHLLRSYRRHFVWRPSRFTRMLKKARSVLVQYT